MAARRRFVFGGLIIAMFVSFMVFNVYRTVEAGIGTFTYYKTVSECYEGRASGQIDAGQGVRIHGRVQPGSIRREPDLTRVHFEVTDGSHAFSVTYGSMDLSDLFKDGAEVVVEGRFAESGHFAASSVMAKCPTKYEAAEPDQA